MPMLEVREDSLERLAEYLKVDRVNVARVEDWRSIIGINELN